MKPEHKEYILNNIGNLSVKRISQVLNLKEKKIWEFLEYQKRTKKQPDSPKEIEKTTKKKHILLSIAFIIILGFVAYGNSLNSDFLWDDKALIEDNRHVKSWSSIQQVFIKSIGAGSGEQSAYYRPLQIVTYIIDYSFWGLNPKGYHFTNILLHVSVALIIYWLINVIFCDNLLSLLTAVFYVVHPIHTEVVTYISGRADSLALLFMLLCFIFYIKSPLSKGIGVHFLMVLSYTLALLSRENSLILPVLLLLYHYGFKKKIEVKEFLSVVGVAGIYLFLRGTVLKALVTQTVYTTTLSERLPGFFVAFTNYVRLLFFPFNLHMEHGNMLFPWGNLKAIFGVVLLSVLLIYAFRKRKDNKLVFFSISWFVIALMPVSNLYPINTYMAEHWLYLPSVGFFLIIAKATHSLYKVRNFKIVTIIFITSLLTFYSYLTIRQNIYWEEPITFYEKTLKYAPNSSRAYSNLGREYNAINRREDAIAAYKKAIEIKPDHAEAYYNLGNVYQSINKNEDAIAVYKKATEIKNGFVQAYNNLGIVYRAIHKNDEAIASYKKAIKIKANFTDAYNNLGNVYKSINKSEEAIVAYKKAIDINPNYINAYDNLGILYVELKRTEEAIALYKRAIGINPGHAITYNNLAVVYFNMKQYKLAIEYYDKAKNLGYTNSALSEALKPYRESQ